MFLDFKEDLCQIGREKTGFNFKIKYTHFDHNDLQSNE